MYIDICSLSSFIFEPRLIFWNLQKCVSDIRCVFVIDFWWKGICGMCFNLLLQYFVTYDLHIENGFLLF